MKATALLLEALRALSDATVPADEVGLTAPVPPEADPSQTTFELTVDLYDLLVERSLAACADDREREALLRTALADVAAVEPVLSWTLSDRSRQTEQLDRAARMRGQQNRLTGEWLLPRLEKEIEMFEARISALRASLEGGSQ